MTVIIAQGNLRGEARVPSSKSAAHRAIIAAAIAKGESRIYGVSECDDITATLRAITALGATAEYDGDCVTVRGIEMPSKSAIIDCGESGSTLRFMIPIAAAFGVNATFIGHGRLPKRPIDDIVNALKPLGISFKSKGEYNLPLEIRGKLGTSEIRIAGNVSSQYLTGALFAQSVHGGKVTLTTELQSAAYVDMTCDMINKFGGHVNTNDTCYDVTGGLSSLKMHAEGDWSAAAFFCEMAALGGEITLTGLDPESHQGDKECINIFRKIGADISLTNGVYRMRKGTLNAIDMDAGNIPDMVPAVAVTLAFAHGKSTIYNAARLRIKESDRLLAVSQNLSKMGIDTELYDDRLIIYGGIPRQAQIDSVGDHRIAMAFASAAPFVQGGLVIDGAESVAKSFPDYFKVLHSIGGDTHVISNG